MHKEAMRPENKALAEQIITQIKAGTEAWEMPWHQGFEEAVNALSNRIYTGYNAVALWQAGKERGYSSNKWATLKQWSKLRGRLRKGAKGVAVYQPRIYTQRYKDGSSKDIVGSYRRYHVFNYEDVNNVNFEHPDLFSESLDQPLDFNSAAEQLIRATGAVINYGGHRAFYRPAEDAIYIPPINSFKPTKTASANENYYSTLLHELVHWTIKEGRSPREQFFQHHQLNYAFEELVAELGASILCSRFHGLVVPREDHAAYISSWLEVLENNFEYFYKALYQAQQAVDWLCVKAGMHISLHEVEEEQEEETEYWFGAQSTIPLGESVAALSYNHSWNRFGKLPAVMSKIICASCEHEFSEPLELSTSWCYCPHCSAANCFNSAGNLLLNPLTIISNVGSSVLGTRASAQKRNNAILVVSEYGKTLLEACAKAVVRQLALCSSSGVLEGLHPMDSAWQEISWCLQQLGACTQVWEGETVEKMFKRSVDPVIEQLTNSFSNPQKVAITTYVAKEGHFESLPKPANFDYDQVRAYVYNRVYERALEPGC